VLVDSLLTCTCLQLPVESCCGEPMEETRSRLADLAEADFDVSQPRCQDSSENAAQQHLQQQLAAQPQQHWPQQQLQHQQQQQVQHSSDGGCSSAGHSSGGCCSTGTVHMGDDFECMASEDVSMLLEDTAEYPGRQYRQCICSTRAYTQRS
jgi:hypothetical protein